MLCVGFELSPGLSRANRDPPSHTTTLPTSFPFALTGLLLACFRSHLVQALVKAAVLFEVPAEAL